MAPPALTWPALADEVGPTKVVQLRDPSAGLEAVVVVDNTACGPAIGGVRMALDVTLEEVARLARAMTLKNASAGLAHGGGKAGIVADPRLPVVDKARLIRAFGRAIRDLVEYIPGPDMGTDEACMGHLHDEIGRAVGLPRVLGGIPLDAIGATGFGLAIAAQVAEKFVDIRLRGARVAIQGFGAVGRNGAVSGGARRRARGRRGQSRRDHEVRRVRCRPVDRLQTGGWLAPRLPRWQIARPR